MKSTWCGKESLEYVLDSLSHIHVFQKLVDSISFRISSASCSYRTTFCLGLRNSSGELLEMSLQISRIPHRLRYKESKAESDICTLLCFVTDRQLLLLLRYCWLKALYDICWKLFLLKRSRISSISCILDPVDLARSIRCDACIILFIVLYSVTDVVCNAQ